MANTVYGTDILCFSGYIQHTEVLMRKLQTKFYPKSRGGNWGLGTCQYGQIYARMRRVINYKTKFCMDVVPLVDGLMAVTNDAPELGK